MEGILECGRREGASLSLLLCVDADGGLMPSLSLLSSPSSSVTASASELASERRREGERERERDTAVAISTVTIYPRPLPKTVSGVLPLYRICFVLCVLCQCNVACSKLHSVMCTMSRRRYIAFVASTSLRLSVCLGIHDTIRHLSRMMLKWH